MSRRQWWVLGIGMVASVPLLFVVFQATRQPSSIPKDRMGQVRTGMSRAEAEAIIGKPPGNYQTRHFNTHPFAIPEDALAWHTDEQVFWVTFHDGKVFQANETIPRPESHWEKVCRWHGF